MKILTITTVGVLGIDLSIANMRLKTTILKGINGLTVDERKELFEYYKVDSIYELINKFSFVTESDLRKLYSNYKENGYKDLVEGLSYKEFKKEMGALGYRKGEFYIDDNDTFEINLFVNKFIMANLDIVKNIFLNIDDYEYIKATSQKLFDNLVKSGKLVLMELK